MPTKLDYLRSKKLNPADELREMLLVLEEQLPRLKLLSSQEALAVLEGLDKIDALLTQLEAEAVDLLSERGRFYALQGQLKKRSRSLLKAVGGPAPLAQHRPQPAPAPDERWWWYIDEMVAARNRQTIKQLVVAACVLVLVLAGLYILYQTVLAPSPEVLARIEAENQSMQDFSAGDYAAALADVNKGLGVAVDNPRLLVLKGVLLDFAGQPVAAQQAFQQARTVLPDLESFYLLRVQVYLTTNQFEKAESDTHALLDINPDSAQGWLMLGQALEPQEGRRQEALDAYQRASELATAQGDNEVVVLARLAMGRLLESVP